MMPILSILIPTIPIRASKFNNLAKKLNEQTHTLHLMHPLLGEVELISNSDKSFLDGGLSIGKKRELLMRKSTGKYLCFLDDDEGIAPNYVETLVRLCHRNADVVTFRNLTKTDHYWAIVDMSLHYTRNDEASPNFIVRRKPWHICPVKSEFAKLYPFEDINYSEDWSWFEQVLKHCTTEAHTEMVLHQYNHSIKHSEADKITRHEANHSI